MRGASSGSLSARGPPRNGAATPPQLGKPSSSASQQQCHSARANVGSTPTRRSDMLLLPPDVTRSNERDLSTSPNARAKPSTPTSAKLKSARTAPELTAKRQSYTPPPAGVPVGAVCPEATALRHAARWGGAAGLCHLIYARTCAAPARTGALPVGGVDSKPPHISPARGPPQMPLSSSCACGSVQQSQAPGAPVSERVVATRVQHHDVRARVGGFEHIGHVHRL